MGTEWIEELKTQVVDVLDISGRYEDFCLPKEEGIREINHFRSHLAYG